MDKIVIFFLSSILIFSSCASDTEPYVPTSSGSPGHILIVMEKNKWKNEPGKTVRALFDIPYEVLPQDEPVFGYSNIPPAAYSDLLEKSRNILIAKISVNVKKSGIGIQKNVHAKPQMIITINAKNNEEFIELFKKNANKIIYNLTKAERDRLISVYKGSFAEKPIINKLKEKHQLYLAVPKGYTLDVDTNNFIWLSRETPRSSQGILIWEYPYTDTLQLTAENLLAKRNKICKKHVPGPADSSYMATEERITGTFNRFSLNKQYAVMQKGLWKITGAKGIFMGGPFVEITIIDEKNGRLITANGYAYGGRKKKRELIRQVEAVLFTLKTTEENPK